MQIVGSTWYVLSIRRQYECWKGECSKEINKTHSPSCKISFLDCSSEGNPERDAWLKISKVAESCDANDDKDFDFGMFAEAFTNEVAGAVFIEKYFYCLWWGMRNLWYALVSPVRLNYLAQAHIKLFVLIRFNN